MITFNNSSRIAKRNNTHCQFFLPSLTSGNIYLVFRVQNFSDFSFIKFITTLDKFVSQDELMTGHTLHLKPLIKAGDFVLAPVGSTNELRSFVKLWSYLAARFDFKIDEDDLEDDLDFLSYGFFQFSGSFVGCFLFGIFFNNLDFANIDSLFEYEPQSTFQVVSTLDGFTTLAPVNLFADIALSEILDLF